MILLDGLTWWAAKGDADLFHSVRLRVVVRTVTRTRTVIRPPDVDPPVWLMWHHESVTGTGPESKVVLIADDNPNIRLLVSATLTSDRFSVLEAANGQEAWRLIREYHPAVVILDWEMPVIDGLELAAVIKGDPQVWDTTMIMLTGRSGRADREAGAQAHADLYLVKPFSPQELLEAVEKA